MVSVRCPKCGEVYHTDMKLCAVRCVSCGTIIVMGEERDSETTGTGVRQNVGTKTYVAKPADAGERSSARPFLFLLLPFASVYLASLLAMVSPFSPLTTLFGIALLLVGTATVAGICGSDVLTRLPVLRRFRSWTVENWATCIGIGVFWYVWLWIASGLVDTIGRSSGWTAVSRSTHGSLLYSGLIVFLFLTLPSAVVWSMQGSKKHKLVCLILIPFLLLMVFSEWIVQLLSLGTTL